MIHSMTAFARESAGTPQGAVTVELRSVNHRYLDCSFKAPDTLKSLEPQLREGLSKALSRGKVECLVRVQFEPGNETALRIDEKKLADLLAAAQRVREQLGDASPLDALAVLKFPGIYCAEDVSEEALKKEALDVFKRAVKNLQETREREGEKLASLILDRLAQVESQVNATRDVLPQLMQHQRDKIIARIADLDFDTDEARLEQELVYMAQKADVEEELDRLDAHIAEVRRALKKGGPCGRRLDFLMQELNREANTLSSKSQSATTTLNAVELKVLIEQMREQIQNIE